jgi:hypothetical protein
VSVRYQKGESNMSTTISPLKQARIDRNWSRALVEDKTEGRIVAVSLERWEHGKSRPRGESRTILCELYRKTAEELGIGDNNAIIGTTRNVPVIEEVPMSDFLRREILSNPGSRLMSLINAWPRRDHRYQELQSAISNIVVEYNASAYETTRRQALKDVALMPILLYAQVPRMQAGNRQKIDTDLLLRHVASGLTSCWHLRRGRDLAFVDESTSEYIRMLSLPMHSPSDTYRKASANLLSQCFRLKGSITEHLHTRDQALSYYQEAINYGVMAESNTEQILANRMMAFSYKRRGPRGYKQALPYAEKAYGLMEKTTPQFIRSFTASGLSSCQAVNGKTEDAKISVMEARDLFDPGVSVPSMYYTESNLLAISAVVSRYDGDWTESIRLWEESLTTSDISAIGSVQGCIQYAETEVSRDDKPRNMDLCVDLVTKSVMGAKELGSEHYLREASEVYNLLRIAWPTEPAIKKLGCEYFGIQKEKQRDLVG